MKTTAAEHAGRRFQSPWQACRGPSAGDRRDFVLTEINSPEAPTHTEGPALMPTWLKRWLQRHQHPASFWLHVVGIPMALAAVVLALVQLWYALWDLWWRPATLLIAGYLLQWIGHRVEGNDMGEMILIKKWRGRPHVAVSPRYARDDKSPSA